MWMFVPYSRDLADGIMSRCGKNTFLHITGLEKRLLNMTMDADENEQRTTASRRAAFLSRCFFLKKTKYTPNATAVDRTIAKMPKIPNLTIRVVVLLKRTGIKSAGTSVLTFGSMI